MSSPAAPRRGLFLATAARVISWPLALAFILLGAVWRLLALVARALRHGTHPEEGAPAGWRRLKAYLRQGAAYVGGDTDEMPRWNGTVRGPNESYGPWHEARRRLRRGRLAMAAWIGLAVYLTIGIAAQAGWIASDHTAVDKSAVYVPPGGPGGTWFLGTDYIGHSVGKMALRGTATALWVGAFSAVLACLVGASLGACAGWFGGWVDDLVVWLYTTLESIPELLLVLALAVVFKTNTGLRDWYETSFLAETVGISLGLFTIVVAVGLTFWTGVCRQVRGEFIRQRDRDYVLAARALGVGTGRIMFRHVFPNVFHLVLISFSLLFIAAIKYEVVLSFLGVGVDPAEGSWGLMINQAKLELLRDPPVWWQLSAATVMLFGLVLCVNLFADALRDALDPRLRG